MTPRLRVLAGPNGSGKSTLAEMLVKEYSVNLYTFLNADVLHAELSCSHKTPCPFSNSQQELIDFVQGSSYPDIVKAPFLNGAIRIADDDYIQVEPTAVTSYTSAVITDFLKEQYLSRRLNFSFESVFSHSSKVDFLRRAYDAGYRNYLYFIATADPCINVNRVGNRAALGGHSVPEEKIRERYERCMKQIRTALPYLHRAYFFDNTLDAPVLLAEYDVDSFTLYEEQMPSWFKRYASFALMSAMSQN